MCWWSCWSQAGPDAFVGTWKVRNPDDRVLSRIYLENDGKAMMITSARYRFIVGEFLRGRRKSLKSEPEANGEWKLKHAKVQIKWNTGRMEVIKPRFVGTWWCGWLICEYNYPLYNGKPDGVHRIDPPPPATEFPSFVSYILGSDDGP